MKFDKKSNIHPRLAWNRPYKSRVGPKRIENMILNCQKWYYIGNFDQKYYIGNFMYKYYQLTIFLILIGNFDQKSNF